VAESKPPVLGKFRRKNQSADNKKIVGKQREQKYNIALDKKINNHKAVGSRVCGLCKGAKSDHSA